MQRRILIKSAGFVAGVAAIGGVSGLAGLIGRGPGGVVSPAAAADQPWPPTITEFDNVLGDPDAPVTIVEYASFTCGHCANFHTESLPTIKEKYIDEGLAKLVFRDFPLDGLALRAGMIARAAPENRFFGVVDVMFQQQSRWIRSDDPVADLSNIALMAGASQADIDQNLEDEALADRIINMRAQGETLYQVNSTPTFVIEGEVIAGNMPLADLESTIEGHL